MTDTKEFEWEEVDSRYHKKWVSTENHTVKIEKTGARTWEIRGTNRPPINTNSTRRTAILLAHKMKNKIEENHTDSESSDSENRNN